TQYRGPCATCGAGRITSARMTQGTHDDMPRFPTTERLTFRLISAADENLYFSLYTDDRVMRFITLPTTPAEIDARFKRALEGSHCSTFKQKVLVAIERATNAPIGLIGLRPVDDKEGAAEGGVMLATTAQARGFAPECLHVLITYAFDT